MQRQRGFGIKIGAALAQSRLEMNSMVRLNAAAFWPSLITSFTSDEARREAIISRMCEEPGFDRERVENSYPCCARWSKSARPTTPQNPPPN